MFDIWKSLLIRILGWRIFIVIFFSGPDLFGHPKLKDFVTDIEDSLEPLLSTGVLNSLMDKYGFYSLLYSSLWFFLQICSIEIEVDQFQNLIDCVDIKTLNTFKGWKNDFMKEKIYTEHRDSKKQSNGTYIHSSKFL